MLHNIWLQFKYKENNTVQLFCNQVLSCSEKNANESFCLVHLRAYKDYRQFLVGTMEDNFLIIFKTSTIFFHLYLLRDNQHTNRKHLSK